MNWRRFRGLFLAAAGFIACAIYSVQAAPQRAGAPAGAAAVASHRALVDQYCVTCHNERAKAGGLTLEHLDLSNVGAHAEEWEKVVRKLRVGMMPPAGVPRPDAATTGAFAGWLETQLDRAAAARPNPGRPALHRLNRTEYANAVHDLLGIDVDAASLLPPDDSSHGFDNIAGSLGVSPVLLERYLAAAVKVSRLAIGSRSIAPAQEVYRAPGDLSQTTHLEGLPFGTRGGLLARHHFPLDGEYSIVVRLLLAPAQTRMGSALGDEQIDVSLDGERLKLFNVDEHDDLKGMELRVHVPAGIRSVGAAFLARNFRSDDALRPFWRTTFDPTICIQAGWSCLPHIGTITITGPLNVTGAGDTPSRRKIFTCHPASAREEETCASEILSRLAARAYRRPLTSNDREILLEFYRAGRGEGGFEIGIETALQRILASPEFVFRFPVDPANVAAGGAYRLSDLELASRLSFFLWSRIPDDELLQVATARRLATPAEMNRQVRRMLQDRRADALVRNFAAQWLYLRNLDSASPVDDIFPAFDDNLRQAFRRETELFVEAIIREDRPVTELLTADYTFVNDRLARHYGIPHIQGSHFRRVTLGPEFDVRRGLLGKGSVLTVTSYQNRTSPVVRGKWILETLLGTPPPEPPPVVPELKEQTREEVGRGQALSVRQRLEEHRTNPGCAGCHRIMDPLGFALENFNAVGEWRTTDEGGQPIDASGELLDGTKVDNPNALRQALVRYSDQFVQTMVEKLLTYAIGRGLEYYDMPAVRQIVREAKQSEYRFSALVHGVVKSAPFQMRIKEAPAAVTATR